MFTVAVSTLVVWLLFLGFALQLCRVAAAADRQMDAHDRAHRGSTTRANRRPTP
jgi:hypothetical protein